MADPRNALLHHYFRLVSEIKPRFFVMENVPGLLLGEARKVLDEAIAGLHGYDILGPLRVNANDFGAATKRERVLIIGFRGVNPITKEMLESRKGIKPTVRDAISDLPSPRKSGVGRYRRIAKLSEYAVRARSTVGTLGDADRKKKVLEGVVSGLLPTDHAVNVVSRFSTVLQGACDPISRCPRLSWKAASPTLRAGTGPDHGSFQSVRPIHPTNNRVITVREAARLQGFPDWFEFHKTKWHSFRMIGNSVSPPLAQFILSVVRNNL
jgi:DNA (cytosine-5)-methyltransferase 1